MENIFNNKNLSPFATKDSDAKRLIEEENDIRPPFFRDIDRIIYSNAFVRYLDKTQVFTYQNNSHITKRMVHVQYVSKIARTIGRSLGLNEDLIEAIALGHDLGHVPFGHVGEDFLNQISLKYNKTYFKHNIHSVRILKEIENSGRGLNLTIQVLDGIMCHNGEILNNIYKPKKKTSTEFLAEYNESYNKDILLTPSSLEGCLVRVCDLVAYLGRDIEDGVRLGLIKNESIPENIQNILGKTNKEIVNTIVLDIIKNSANKNHIKLSKEVFSAMSKLKEFNYNYIYNFAYTKDQRKNINNMFNELFSHYLNNFDLLKKEYPLKSYLEKREKEYLNLSKVQIIIDFIAGMTDKFFIEQYDKYKERYEI